MKVLDFEKIEIGDIILLDGRTKFISPIIKIATRSDISHAMICHSKGWIMDSTGDGVTPWPMENYHIEDSTAIYVLRPVCGLNDDEKHNLITFLHKKIGERYNTCAAVNSVVKLIPGDLTDHRQFCSRLVAQAYDHIGVNLVKNPNSCTPEDLKRVAASESCNLLNFLTDFTKPSPANVFEKLDTNINYIHNAARKHVLKIARSVCENIESLEDIYTRIIHYPEDENKILRGFEDSGFFDTWKFYVVNQPWKYTSLGIEELDVSHEEKLNYVNHVFNKNFRYYIDLSLKNVIEINEKYPRKLFEMLINMYRNISCNYKDRQAAAGMWKLQNFPDDTEEISKTLKELELFDFEVVNIYIPKM